MRHEVNFFGEFVILIPEGGEEPSGCDRHQTRRRAVPLGVPAGSTGGYSERGVLARPMWTDEIATIDDIPDPGMSRPSAVGFAELDEHGFRLTLPAFMPIIGPYGSGKSVLLRQLLVNLWQAAQMEVPAHQLRREGQAPLSARSAPSSDRHQERRVDIGRCRRCGPTEEATQQGADARNSGERR